MSDHEPLLKIRGVSKRFTGTLALDNVDLDIEAGEVHALLGENGAGKSTLIKILAGVYNPDQGDFWFKGKKKDILREKLPISFIHQDLGLVESMTIAENVALVAGYKKKNGLISWSQTRNAASEILKMIGCDIDPEVKVSSISSAEQSLVAIARAMAIKTDLIVLDEPTATLPETDVAKLFDVLKQLKAQGIGIIYITHRLDEVFRIADRVTVLRNGKKISTSLVSETNPDDLILKIVGKEPSDVFIRPTSPTAETILEVDKIKIGRVGPVSFSLKAGEILGLVGLRGAGHDIIGRGIFGSYRIAGGTIRIRGKNIKLHSPIDAMRNGIGFVSSKRIEESLAGKLLVRENIYLNPVGKAKNVLSPIKRGIERKMCEDALDKFTIKPRDGERVVSTLSGGNQQKVVLARWFELGSKILILEEPTTGVDVGAKADIYAMMQQGLEKGMGILLVSSDFEEVSHICHRAIIFNRGLVVDEIPGKELSVEKLTAVASGIKSAV